MNYSILIVPIIIVAIFFSFGSFLTLNKKSCSYEAVVYGFGFTILLINTLYFLLNVSLLWVSKIIILLFLLTFIILVAQNRLKYLIKVILSSLPLLILFILLDFFYGEQFYIFRGNIYDQFSYLSTGMVFSEFKYAEALDIYKSWFISGEAPNDHIIHGIPALHARSTTQLLLGILLNIDFVSVAGSGYIFKIITTLLSFFAFISLLKTFLYKKKYSILIAGAFSLSYFNLYNVEIDALSLIGFMPFFILILKKTPSLIDNIKKNEIACGYYYSFITACSFIIYPNGSAAVSLPILFYLIYEIFKKKVSLSDFRYILFYFILLLILIIPFYKSTIMYLIESEIKIGLTTKLDFWGYYGAFIFGKSNPIYNMETIVFIKNLWLTNYPITDLILEIGKINFDSGNIFFILNIIPSAFGFYHFTTSIEYPYMNYVLVIFLLYISYNIIITFIRNLRQILISKNNFLVMNKFIVIYFLIFFFVLIFKSLFWAAIKLFFIFSPIFFLIVSFNFLKNQRFLFPKYLFIILLSLFPLYKYTQFNSGIGRVDSFPSVMKKEYKTNVIWKIDKNKLSKCKKIKYSFDDRFKSVYISMVFNKTRKNFKNINDLTTDCEVSFVKKNFIVSKL